MSKAKDVIAQYADSEVRPEMSDVIARHRDKLDDCAVVTYAILRFDDDSKLQVHIDGTMTEVG